MILPGGAMVGEAGFTRIPAFEGRYRVIAPSYASVSTADELLDGLAGVLDAEGVREAHVLGPSYGGMVAQCFVRRHPERVRTLILANTLVPPRRMLRLARIFLALLPLVPVGWLRALRERGLSRAFYGVPSVPPEDQVFWRDYQHGLVSRMSKAEPMLHVPARDRPHGELPVRAGRPRLLAGAGLDPGVGRGPRDAGAARRAQAVLSEGQGVHVPRRRAHALDEPQGGVPLRHQRIPRPRVRGPGHDVHSWFDEIRKDDIALAGGKGANLGELSRAGLPVPPGFVVTTAAYDAFVEANGIEGRDPRAASVPRAEDPAAFEEVAEGIRALFPGGKFPRRWPKRYAPPTKSERRRRDARRRPLLGHRRGPGRGELRRPAGDLPERARRRGAARGGQGCWASLWTARAMAYRAARA